ncbi:MAG: ABC transporter permease [Bacteroides sp.]|nr:ABC transporter permease [Bacteroides sp.]
MLQHNLIVAVRNLLKYKMQTLVSVVGLAIGFTCFALSLMWIRYETGYDSAYEGADRMYLIYSKSNFEESGYGTHTAYPISTSLKEDFPEVEAACAFLHHDGEKVRVEENPQAEIMAVGGDSCFMQLFDIELLAGNLNFLYRNEEVAITERAAKRLFGTTDVLGREYKECIGEKPRTICAVLKDLEHSNFSFDVWRDGAYVRQWHTNWYNGSFNVCVKLRKGVDPVAFQQKLNASEKDMPVDFPQKLYQGLMLKPLKAYRYSDLNKERNIKLEYLVLFSVAGGLVILCSLFNYLSLFITRMGIRRREMALRRVCGSSGWGVFGLLLTEYLLMLLASGLLGMSLLELCHDTFCRLSGVEGGIYHSSLLYFAGVLAVSLLMLLPFVRRPLKTAGQGNRHTMRRLAIFFQLTVAMLFIFCMSAIMKQVYFLRTTDLGWERKGLAAFTFVYPHKIFDELADKVAAMPFVREVLPHKWGLLPAGAQMSLRLVEWDDKPEGAADVSLPLFPSDGSVTRFYGIRLADGEHIDMEKHKNGVVLNETAVKALGLTDPVGKHLRTEGMQKNGTSLEIVGVAKDFHILPPTIPVRPMGFIGAKNEAVSFYFGGAGHLLVKFHEGEWPKLEAAVADLFAREYPEGYCRLVHVEEVYDNYLKSETLLLKLLSFMALVCILISAFGIFSYVTLSCEQRRKEVAIRKVNGAKVGDILRMFAREYLLLLLMASAVAFSVGYVLMRRWLQDYVERTSLSLWLFLSIFTGVALVVALCVGWRVWRAATQNPAGNLN